MRTSSGRRAARRASFEWVNTRPGDTGAAITGASHGASPKHARSRRAGFAHRFSRGSQLDSIVERLDRAAVHADPRPCHVLAAGA